MSAAEVAAPVDAATWMGEIPEHWDVARLKYVAKLGTGHTPSRQHPEYWEDCTIRWVTLADVWQLRDGRETTITETAEKISEVGLANSAAVLHPAGTVVLSRTASVGFSAMLGIDAATSQDFMTWTCGPRLEPKYLLYVLRAMKQEFRRLVMGSTHKTIYMPDIERLTIPLPPLDEQQMIARLLDVELPQLDRIGAAKGRLIGHLGERKDSLVTSALVGDFRQDAADRQRRTATPVADALANLPPTWRRERLKYHVDLNLKTLSESTPPETEIEYIDISTVDSGGRIGKPSVMTFADAPARARRVVRGGDTIVSTVRTYLRAIAQVPAAMDGHICSTGFAVLSPRTTLDARLLYYWTRSAPFIEEVRARSVGVSYPAINASEVVDIQCPLPPQHEQALIASRLDSSIANVERLTDRVRNQLDLLEEHRATLILNSVTGRLKE